MDKALTALFLSVCISNADPIKVRLTTYHRGEDSYTRRLKSASGYTLKEGISVAADPRVFGYGNWIYIDGIGARQVHDTGSAVISRKASGGKFPVIDVFFHKRKDAEAFANSHKYALVYR